MTQNNGNGLTNYTANAPGGITVSLPKAKQAIEVMNNKSRYYADLAKQYKNEAKEYRDSARTYAEENSDVTMLYVNELEARLQRGIDSKQASGDYALNSSIPTKVSDLTNDSGYLTTSNIATESDFGVVKPDGTTIVADENGVISANRADLNISNLSNLGNARLQYAPFSINAGAVNDGENSTLRCGSSSTPITYTKYAIPEVSANTTEYGTCTDYKFTKELVYSGYQSTINWTMNLAQSNYIPQGVTASFTLTAKRHVQGNANYNTNGCKIIYTYTDDTTETVYDSQNLFSLSSEEIQTATAICTASSKEVKSVNCTMYKTGTQVAAGSFKLWYSAASSSTSDVICNSCTITTCDGRTKIFEDSIILDLSNEADGNYLIFKDITTGELSLKSNFSISKTAPLSPSNDDYWLDIAVIPACLKKYNGSAWIMNNDLVYIGNVMTSSGAVASLTNRKFNDSGYVVDKYSESVIIDTYINGTSWYRIYSDGWCEQGGVIIRSATGILPVSLLKNYKNTSYSIMTSLLAAENYSSTLSPNGLYILDKTASGFSISSPANATNIHYFIWEAKGYLI